MATQQLNPAPRPQSHPFANPGYGKRLAPSQDPRRADDFAHLPRREAAIAGYIDRLPEGADISLKTLAKHLADYGQCAVGTALRALSVAGPLRRHREQVFGANDAQRWVWRTYWSRAARDDDWWEAFTSGAAEPADPRRGASPPPSPRSRRVRAGSWSARTCGVPGEPESLPGGLCGGCRGEGGSAPAPAALPADQVHDHVGQLRAALRTTERNQA